MKQSDVAVVVINWNGKQDSLACIESLLKQSKAHKIIAVDNNSSDGFVEEVEKRYPSVILLRNKKNFGFSGGANTGMRHAVKNGFNYVALINNDARPDADWLKYLVRALNNDRTIGIATCKLLKLDGTFDSTGDFYTNWGLAFPRGRSENDRGQYNKPEFVFGASGGASIYRTDMLKEIGMFDDDFFAYYEDVDLSFRAQLNGWKVAYEPLSIAHHEIGGTSSSIPGFTTYMTIKNLPWILIKNVPLPLFLKILPKFTLAYWSIIFSSLSKGKFIPVCKGLSKSLWYTPKKFFQRYTIQRNKNVTSAYIDSILVHDLPENASKLRRIRSFFMRSSP
jgi:GT2 family glycosyltransferase